MFSPPPLSAEHLQQLAAARTAAGKIRRAAVIANVDGVSIAVFAALTCLGSVGSVPGMLLGGGMGLVAAVELRNAGRLRLLQPQAARTLGLNQLALAAMLILYASWCIYAELTGPGAYASIKAADAQVATMLGPIEELTRLIVLAVYAGVIAVALLAQGGLAVFYFSRVKHIRAYLTQTPDWILQMQRAGVSL